MDWRKGLPTVVLAIALLTGGCAGPVVVAGLSANELLTGASVTATIFSGKGAGEHALDMVTGLDCRIVEGALRKDRRMCEPRGSPATARDFKGLYTLLGIDANGRQRGSALAAAPAPPAAASGAETPADPDQEKARTLEPGRDREAPAARMSFAAGLGKDPH